MNIEDIRAEQKRWRESLQTSKPVVGASVHKVAEQFYCEKQVDLALSHGDRENAQTSAGTEGHASATARSEAVPYDEFWDDVATDELVRYSEVPFSAEVAEVVLTGRTDLVEFQDGQPTAIVERKFTDRHQLYPDQEFQAWLYSYLLDVAGFDCENLRYAVLKIPRPLKAETDVLGMIDQHVLELMTEGVTGTHQPFDEFGVYAHIHDYRSTNRFASPYESRGLLEGLQWALGYWREEREPVPTSVAGKCRGCDFRAECPDSRV
jgi:hypothetical protein